MSKTIKILKLMDNWKQFTNVQICEVAGWRFGWYLHILRTKWVIFSKEWPKAWDKDYIEYWKIEHIPTHLDYSWKQLKTIKNNENTDVQN